MRPPSGTLLVALVLGRLLFVPLVMGYAQGVQPDPFNLSIIATYFMMSFSGGAAAMLVSQRAQSLCDHGELPCPIVAQITWLALQLGGLVGAAASFVQ